MVMKTIKTGKCELLLVKVPEDAITNFLANVNDETVIVFNYDNERVRTEKLPKDNYQFISTLKDISEEQAKEVVLQSLHSDLFMHHNGLDNIYCYKTALDSLNSLMQANEIYLVNPYKEDWDNLCTWGHGSFAKDGKSEYQLFTEAEYNTGDWVILKVI